MKKILSLFLLFALVSGVCFSQSKKKDPLDLAIRESSDYLNANLEKGSKIVIINIQSDNNALSEYIIDELIFNTVNDKVLLAVDRQQLDAIRAEQNFQFSGEVDDKQALEIGKFFGAQIIVSGSIGMVGKEYRLRIRALEVQTALVQGQFNKNIAKSSLITKLAASKPAASKTKTSASGVKTTATPAAATNKGITIINNTGSTISMGYLNNPASLNMDDWSYFKKFADADIKDGQTKTFDIAPDRVNKFQDINLFTPDNILYQKFNIMITEGIVLTFIPEENSKILSKQVTNSTPATGVTGAYKIGDRGPSAGFIFYDKGNNSDGWRYLEAASTDWKASWSTKGTSVQNLRPEIGEGKRNTQLIVDTFKKASGEWDTAAQKCDDLVFRGFDDWFLPSKDELDQMYGQLKRKDLGNFKNEWYWSSSGGDAQLFRNGDQAGSLFTHQVFFVRPIRQVRGPSN